MKSCRKLLLLFLWGAISTLFITSPQKWTPFPDGLTQQDFQKRSMAAVLLNSISSSRGFGYQLLLKHRTLWQETSVEERGKIREVILYGTGRALSEALRAYFLIGMRPVKFLYTSHCNATDWLLNNIQGGIFLDPPQPFFPPELYDVDDDHLIADSLLYDPLESPYTYLQDKFQTLSPSTEIPPIDFSAGKIVYLPLGWKSIGGKERPTGFVLLVFGTSPETRPISVYKDSLSFAEKVLKKIPPGVLYVDAVDPKKTEDLDDGEKINPLKVFQALGYPYLDPAYELQPLIALSTPHHSAYYYNSSHNFLLRIRATKEFTTIEGHSFLWAGLSPEAPPQFNPNSHHIEVKILKANRVKKIYIDWGDGTGEFVDFHPSKVIHHRYPYNHGYFITIINQATLEVIARLKVFITWSTNLYKPTLPPEDYEPGPSKTTDPALNALLEKIYEWNKEAPVSSIWSEKFFNIDALPSP